MGQCWIIANIDKHEAISLQPSISELCDANYEFETYRLYSQLLEKKWKSVREIMDYYSLPKRKDTPHSLGYLDLPVELIQIVFSCIEDPWTAFRLGCANTRLLVIGEKRIRQLTGPPQWRGDRIICFGDCCDEDEDDIPEGLDLGDDYEEFCDSVHEDRRNPFEWAHTFQTPSSDRWKYGIHLSWGIKSDWRSSSMGFDMSWPIYLGEEPSVLWNLSKQVYVRRELLPNDESRATKKHGSANVLGRILLFQIYWSTTNRGKWAGDRFELTGNDVLESRLKEEGSKWEDVSEEIIKLIK